MNRARAELMTRLVQSAVKDAGYTSGARVVCLVLDGEDELVLDVVTVLLEDDRECAAETCIDIVCLAHEQMMKSAGPSDLPEPS